jgi:hypothetical protein
MAFAPAVVDAVAPVPVVAAGEIADGRGVVTTKPRLSVVVQISFARRAPIERPIAGQVLEVAESHLGAAGIVDAQKQDDRPAVVAVSLHFGQRGQTLTRKPLSQQRQVVRHHAGDGAAGRRYGGRPAGSWRCQSWSPPLGRMGARREMRAAMSA